MRKIIGFILLIIIFPITAKTAVNEEIASLALKGQELIFERRYDDALAFFKNIEQAHLACPLGLFGQMAVMEVRMLEREDFHLQNEFLELSKKGDDLVNKTMQRYHPPPEDLFFSGALIGLHGFFDARRSKWWSAYTKGSISRQIFNSILKKDPNFIDATFGLGMYIYWRSVFTKELSFLPFFPDRRKEGIEIVERAAREGILTKEMAQVNLGVIYFEEKRYQDAANVFAGYVKRYPNNVILRSFLGRVLLSDKKYDPAVNEFEKILKIDPSLPKTRYFIAMSIIMPGKKEKFPEAENHLKEMLKTTNDKLWRSYTLYWLGMLKEKQGDIASAKNYYQDAVKLNRGLKSAQVRLRGLGGGI